MLWSISVLSGESDTVLWSPGHIVAASEHRGTDQEAIVIVTADLSTMASLYTWDETASVEFKE